MGRGSGVDREGLSADGSLGQANGEGWMHWKRKAGQRTHARRAARLAPAPARLTRDSVGVGAGVPVPVLGEVLPVRTAAAGEEGMAEVVWMKRQRVP